MGGLAKGDGDLILTRLELCHLFLFHWPIARLAISDILVSDTTLNRIHPQGSGL